MALLGLVPYEYYKKLGCHRRHVTLHVVENWVKLLKVMLNDTVK